MRRSSKERIRAAVRSVAAQDARVTNTFKDHFSGHATSYAAARPTYPDALFAYLAAACGDTALAWDCATGNGQAARSLASHFSDVIATDASAAQVAAAEACAGVQYRKASAESSGLATASVDLVTVAQALHWFDVHAFFAEASRVLRPNGLLAYWCYGLCEISPECDALIRDAYDFVDAYWPPERAIVERGYVDIEPPGTRLETPEFAMQIDWTAEQMLAYVATWSANQRYAGATGNDPMQRIARRLQTAWGDTARPVRWPLYLTLCRPAG